jgi:hypothetical protein
MYGLNSKDTDLSFLLYKEVQQVCIGLYQVILNFDSDVSISVECRVAHHLGEDGKVEEWSPSGSASRSSLPLLLGSRISDVTVVGRGTLRIVFSNRNTLLLYDESDEHESYQISYGGRLIVV